MVLHRLLDPGSKRATHRWLKTVYRPEFESLELQHLYRALDQLAKGKEVLEEALFSRNRDPFSLEVYLVLFDTTLVHFEGKGRKTWLLRPALATTPTVSRYWWDCVSET